MNLAARRRTRLSVVLSHPVQYYSPWFQQMQRDGGIDVHVHYLWGQGSEADFDPQFGRERRWDIPLLEGYAHSFVPNVSRDPGPHHFDGLDNPRLVDALHAARPDAVLMFGYAYRSHVRALLSPRLAQVPFLLRGDSHDMGRVPGWRSTVSRMARRVLFRRFAGALAVGRANTDYLLASGFAPDRIHRAPHCVDNARFRAAAPAAHEAAIAWRRDLGIAPDARVFVFAGKFEPKKRPLDLLRAYLDLVASTRGRASALLFIGSGTLEHDIRALADDATGRSVFFAPFQNQSVMPRAYAAGDVFVLPSHGAGETWGLAVNEAMNIERPVIVSSHVGCGPDLVLPERTGWVFPAGDVASLRETMSGALALDGDRLEWMGAQARGHVAAFSYEAATVGLNAALVHIRRSRRPLRSDRRH